MAVRQWSQQSCALLTFKRPTRKVLNSPLEFVPGQLRILGPSCSWLLLLFWGCLGQEGGQRPITLGGSQSPDLFHYPVSRVSPWSPELRPGRRVRLVNVERVAGALSSGG